MVFAQNLEVFYFFGNQVQRIFVQNEVINDQIYEECIAPGRINDGQRLNLGQVDVVLGKNIQYFCQAALVVLRDKFDRGLVLYVFHLARMVGRIFTFLQYEKSRRIVLNGLNVI